jgi:hypothetical protein
MLDAGIMSATDTVNAISECLFTLDLLIPNSQTKHSLKIGLTSEGVGGQIGLKKRSKRIDGEGCTIHCEQSDLRQETHDHRAC